MNEFALRLLAWFDLHGRKDLPWQQAISPYRVWVSEIMLQQTQVKTVIPYFENFMARFPAIHDLAAASQDEVLHHWTGLGYYARARNLHKTAKIIVAEHEGEMPLTVDALVSLPGIGRSTAGAIVSICSGRRAAILDGNVKRVLARHFAIEGWPGSTAAAKSLWAKAEELTPVERVADYTQAIMDLGATVCTRATPACEQCPMHRTCIALATNRIAELLGKKPKKDLPVRQTTMLIIESGNSVLLEQRPPAGLWGGLWSFPESDDPEAYLQAHNLSASCIESMPSFRHTFTHFHLDIDVFRIVTTGHENAVHETGRFCWYDRADPPALGLTRPVTRLLAE